MAPKKTLHHPLYSAEICMLLNEHTYQDCEYIIRTKHVIYESKFQRAIRSYVSLIPWYCTCLYQSVGYTVCAYIHTGIMCHVACE